MGQRNKSPLPPPVGGPQSLAVINSPTITTAATVINTNMLPE